MKLVLLHVQLCARPTLTVIQTMRLSERLNTEAKIMMVKQFGKVVKTLQTLC